MLSHIIITVIRSKCAFYPFGYPAIQLLFIIYLCHSAKNMQLYKKYYSFFDCCTLDNLDENAN